MAQADSKPKRRLRDFGKHNLNRQDSAERSGIPPIVAAMLQDRAGMQHLGRLLGFWGDAGRFVNGQAADFLAKLP